jgi:predicted transcriptional regulator
MGCGLSLVLLALLEVPLDATVETSSGARLQLATLWKQPTVLFYEDRGSTDLNLHVKEALAAAGQARGLAEAVAIVAVANVAAYDFFPARNFVLAAIRDVEKKYGITVYLDFSGGLARPPWSLQARGSTVVLLDRAGVLRSRWRGQLQPDDVKALLAQVAELLGP